MKDGRPKTEEWKGRRGEGARSQYLNAKGKIQNAKCKVQSAKP
jgi:hypothetical protein